MDTKIRDLLMERVDELKDLYVGIFNRYKRRLEDAKTVEDIMIAKRRMTISITKWMPLSAYHCYFCNIDSEEYDEDKCENCEYTKTHGECHEEDSVFMKIIRAKSVLIEQLRKY